MIWGSLSEHFIGVGWKRLSAHEVDATVSNGHEFQGVANLKAVLGDQRREFAATYLLIDDDDSRLIRVRARATWYDARENDPSRSAEWRLYYPHEAGAIQAQMKPGDLMIIARSASDSLAVLLAPRGSTREAQLGTIFGITAPAERAEARLITSDDRLSFLAARLLEELGLASPEPSGSEIGIIARLADEFLRLYPDRLPRGEEVSARIQSEIIDVDAGNDPDFTLTRWVEAEDAVFRQWEDGLIARRLMRGFVHDGRPDVRGFRAFAMVTRQSRVSRAGRALQFHLASILRLHGLRFEEQARTEGGEIPDFLFPGATEYDDPAFPVDKLRMLGAKFTAKERWRQVLHEAARIEHKHLLTLEAPISARQLSGMRVAKLQLVIPKPYQQEFPPASRTQLVSLADFISDVRSTQEGPLG